MITAVQSSPPSATAPVCVLRLLAVCVVTWCTAQQDNAYTLATRLEKAC